MNVDGLDSHFRINTASQSSSAVYNCNNDRVGFYFIIKGIYDWNSKEICYFLS